ncbi:hypothetical protein M111_0098 [Bacteroides fragilis str. 3986T(B)10]|nr:hypothetical protein M111_0098 [Bacteroides fragilis str. 3986T(B)10]EYA68518.1 hypothetical protein M139_0125 [Bacteroides fragilis str. S23L24]EYE48234.1 hypothetical protein M138_0134 [Bacteroides fragilis str. S23L17]
MKLNREIKIYGITFSFITIFIDSVILFKRFIFYLRVLQKRLDQYC